MTPIATPRREITVIIVINASLRLDHRYLVAIILANDKDDKRPHRFDKHQTYTNDEGLNQ